MFKQQFDFFIFTLRGVAHELYDFWVSMFARLYTFLRGYSNLTHKDKLRPCQALA